MMRRAFTLIELLVVIAVIAILAGLLFPVFTRARERAKSTQCINNLKQLGTAIRTYLDDWNGRYPAAYEVDYADPAHGKPLLQPMIEPFLRSRDVWVCPSDWGETF